jgi:microcystin-dependent protein
MAGTVPSLALSTQFDKNGNLLAGGKLYFFQANTLIPQNVYSDTGLSLALPNPITLDAAGRVPEFYCADGSIRARLVDKSGVVQIDAKNILVIGPSGGGGGGSTVDATTIFQTGDVIWLDQSGARSGWVRDNGRTIGSASSGASERANSDCQSLFTFLWQTYSDTVCPVLGGRGANAAADWAANKQITLPDKRGRSAFGDDAMGNLAANRLSGVTFTTGDATTPGSLGGEAVHTLLTGEIPAHKHAALIYDPQHVHTLQPLGTGAGGGPSAANPTTGGTYATSGASLTGVRVKDAAGNLDTTDSVGGGGAHNNMPPFIIGTFYRKL